MKTLLMALGLVAAGGTFAQTTTEEQFEAKMLEHGLESLVIEETDPQHLIELDDTTISGVSVALFKADNKLQLLNPVAPEKYGTVEDSIVRDPITGQASGLKLFSLTF